jgi:hypothetical protein
MDPRIMRIAVVSTAALMVVGGLGAWATAGPLSVNGGDRDGVIVIVCAVIVAIAAVVASRAVAVIGLLAAIASTATAIYDIQDIQGTAFISVGWGLWLALVASIVAVLDTVMLIVARRATAPA